VWCLVNEYIVYIFLISNINITCGIVLCRYAKPISVARRVLECSTANMLVGDGATQFARDQGFEMEDNYALLTAETRQAYTVKRAT